MESFVSLPNGFQDPQNSQPRSRYFASLLHHELNHLHLDFSKT